MSFYNKLKQLIARSPEAESLDGTEKLLVLADPEGAALMKSATTQQIADLGGGGGEVVEEVFLAIAQSGTNAPTMAPIYNTTGRTFVGVYQGVGSFEVHVDEGDPLPSTSVVKMHNLPYQVFTWESVLDMGGAFVALTVTDHTITPGNGLLQGVLHIRILE